MIFETKAKKYEAWVYAICVFLLIPPFFMWTRNYTSYLCLLITLLLTFRNHISISEASGRVSLLLFVISQYFWIRNFADHNFKELLVSSIVSVLFLVKGNFLIEVFKKFSILFAITLVPSIILHLLVNIFGFGLPSVTIAPLHPTKTYNYQLVYFLVTSNLDYFERFRFCGIYDEPGVIGTISALILFAKRYDLRRNLNIPVFIGGLLSLSLFFYLATLIYFVTFTNIRYKILAFIFVAIFFLSFQNNAIMTKLIFDRTRIEDGRLSGDNRSSSSFDNWYNNNFIYSSDYFFGLGIHAKSKYNYSGASYKDIILIYGIIPVSLFYFIFIYFAHLLMGFGKYFFIFTIILLISSYQRPFIGQFHATIMFLAALYFMSGNIFYGKKLKRFKYG